MKKLFLIALIVAPYMGGAQNWKLFGRHEVSAGIGPSIFFGDLGGSSDEGAHLFSSFKDLDVPSTRYALNLGYRYKIASNVNLRANLLLGQLSGSDTESDNYFREVRNASFKSPIYELGLIGEYYFIKEKVAMDAGLADGTGSKPGLSAYLMGGVAGLYFNPQGLYNGEWMALQPLGTEGQTDPDSGTDKYSRLTAAYMYGLGLKYGLSSKVSIGLEVAWRHTFSDYIDDVSTNYYDPALVAAANPDNAAAAAYFSNPMDPNDEPLGYTRVGDQRGDSSNNDSYLFTILSLNYKFIKTSTHLPKF